MKKCNMCGSFVSDKATQCPKCGVEIKEDIIPEVKVPEVHMPEVKEVKEETNSGNFCPSCGNKLDADAIFCSRCGKNLNPSPVVSTVTNTETPSNIDKELNDLNNVYAKKASTNLTLAIVSVVLCCCSITGILSLIFSILSLKDLGKMSFEVKNTSTYRSIRNKNVIALIIACFVVFMWFTSLIENIRNPQNYEDLVNSLNNIINGGY